MEGDSDASGPFRMGALFAIGYIKGLIAAVDSEEAR
jgi:hypothetical protein